MGDVQRCDVLIVGAGPTGLVLALWLARAGISVRIIDRTAAPGTTSRAIVFHARNLEFYQQLGIAQLAVQGGEQLTEGNLWVGGRRVAGIELGRAGEGVSPYPFMLIFPQDRQEEMLIGQLALLNVHVERGTALVSFEQDADGVHASLQSARGIEMIDARYVGGCDGAHSTVREVLGTQFTGGTYNHVFYVADLEATGPVVDGRLHLALDDADFLAIFAMKGEGRVRVVGAVQRDAADTASLGWADVSGHIAERLHLAATTVRWFSTYRVHHRVADSFRRERVFLLGDAAHVHSPVGGQGMNTGIGDAVNLAWKLAAVLRGEASDSVLATYETERMPFARKLVATTDRAFEFVSARGRIAARVRVTVAPLILPILFRFRAMRRLMFRTLSQTAIQYRASALSRGVAGEIHGGDRLPWVPAARAGSGDNYTPLTSRQWQLHVFGAATAGTRTVAQRSGLALHELPWVPAAAHAGFDENTAYLVRPDGYVGMIVPQSRTVEIEEYLQTHGLRLDVSTS